MLGAIIGDLAGSIYEFNQLKNFKNIKVKNIIEDNSFFSDDTILTVAIADAILNNCDYGEKLKEYINKYINYKPNFTPYFSTAFSPNVIKWAGNEVEGKSAGNGAMMRISPIGYLFNTKKDIVKQSRLATIPSHNSKEALLYSTTISLIIYYARKGLKKQQIIDKLNLTIRKPKLIKFNTTCAETIDVCLYSLFNTNSFEGSIRLAISFGGDTDTNACIVGAMAEAMYGVPDKFRKQALEKLPNEFVDIINRFYERLETTTLRKITIM